MADKVSVAEFVKLALDLTNEELRQAVEFLNREYRNRISRAAREAAAALRPGDWVEVTQGSRKLPAGLRGHVVEVRREQVDVHFPEHGSGYWTLTALLVRKVEGPRH